MKTEEIQTMTEVMEEASVEIKRIFAEFDAVRVKVESLRDGGDPLYLNMLDCINSIWYEIFWKGSDFNKYLQQMQRDDGR